MLDPVVDVKRPPRPCRVRGRLAAQEARQRVGQRLASILTDPTFSATQLDLARRETVGRSVVYPDLELLTGDRLVADQAESYRITMAPAVIRIYEEVCSGERKGFPKQFWLGKQGELNFVICFTHSLETKAGVRMNKETGEIDPRLLKAAQEDFLISVCGSSNWKTLLEHLKLIGGFAPAFDSSTSALMRASYPWAFNLRTKEGNHFHPDEFRQSGIWHNLTQKGAAYCLIDHIFRRHLGLTIDDARQIFDQRLRPENHTEYLASMGHTCWRDLFVAQGGGSILACVTAFEDKIGKMLAWRYPWLFDRSKPEGEHLHLHDFDPRNPYSSDRDLRDALLHEMEPEGRQIQDAPRFLTHDWITKHRLHGLMNLSRLAICRRAFAPEYAAGLFSEADFRSEGTRGCKPARLRRITLFRQNRRETYGTIHLDRVIYYFDKDRIGQVVRKASSEHAVVYNPVKVHNGGGKQERLIFRPVGIIRLVEGPRSYHRPEILPYDPEHFPEISKELETVLLEENKPAHTLSIETQKTLAALYRTRGPEAIRVYISRLSTVPQSAPR